MRDPCLPTSVGPRIPYPAPNRKAAPENTKKDESCLAPSKDPRVSAKHGTSLNFWSDAAIGISLPVLLDTTLVAL
jgi:hypothetical protein